MKKMSRRSIGCMARCLLLVALAYGPMGQARAEVKLPALFSDHLVLQRDHANPVWGWADPGEKVTVLLGGKAKQATADAAGKWRVVLDPLPVGGPHELVVEGKSSRLAVQDVLVGEVWVCSGQSNMHWTLNDSRDADLFKATAHYPQLRMIKVSMLGTQEPQEDFEGEWQPAIGETIADFSGVGYLFGLTLHQALEVPVGLIHDSWGGSSCEAWVPRPLLEADAQYQALIDRWREIEAKPDEKGNQEQLVSQLRPGNCFNGMLRPIIGYGMRGVIWYQGEANTDLAYQYRHMFPLMIRAWRDVWQQGDFPFYWVQLPDFKDEQPEPSESKWAELREAQAMTLVLPQTGQAVTIDLGEANSIHPVNKEDVAKRLARWALALDYGVSVAYRSPEYRSMEKAGNRIIVSLDHVGGALKPFDVDEIRGFAIAGADRKFVAAQAKVLQQDPTKVEVWSDAVPDPVAVRYAWADNPVCNLRSSDGLPVTPFRTDDWPGITAQSE